jgi:hypothetical protein
MGCGCSDSNAGAGCNSITVQRGATGDAGAGRTIDGVNVVSVKEVTVQRLDTSSDSINTAGVGYDWTVLTISDSIATTNTSEFETVAQIYATDVHLITASVLKNGVAVANITMKVTAATAIAGATWTAVPFSFKLSNLRQNDVIKISYLSSSGAVGAVLKGAYADINIIQ